MKKIIYRIYLFSSIILPLTIMMPIHTSAATANTYLPHIDAFTFAAAPSTDLPKAGIYVNMAVANVNDYVNIRTAPSTEADIIGRIYDDAVAKIIKYAPEDDSWIQIESGELTGYVKAEFFLTGMDAVAAIEDSLLAGNDLVYAKSIEELHLDLRQNIVDFALQYVGNPYVHGGNSLTKGTDCSGFTSLVYAEFGYSLSRTPSGQLSSNGTEIEYSDIQPGDIICYSSNGKTCTHVAIYIGDGQIVHAANSKKGIIIGKADYSTIIGIKNIVD